MPRTARLGFSVNELLVFCDKKLGNKALKISGIGVKLQISGLKVMACLQKVLEA